MVEASSYTRKTIRNPASQLACLVNQFGCDIYTFLSIKNSYALLWARRRRKIFTIFSCSHTFSLQKKLFCIKKYYFLHTLKRPKMRFLARRRRNFFWSQIEFIRKPPLFVPDLEQGGAFLIIIELIGHALQYITAT